jgi:thermostable 8-oxoguanine DNA glycosylase
MSKSSYLTNEELLENIARDLKEMHQETGIDLAYWDTALEIVRRFYVVDVKVTVRDGRND